MPTENRSSNNEQMVSVPRELLERCDFGKNTAVAMAALPELRALLAQPAAQHRICIEARECEGCNHIGIDDAHNSLAACHECDWSGPEPVEDKCPGCERENVMAAACPDCGCRYVLAASKGIKAPAAQHQGEPVFMVRSHGSCCWEESNGEGLDIALSMPDEYEVRKLYPHPPTSDGFSAGDMADQGAKAFAARDGEVERLRAALKFYADREHYHFESGNWDTVSGEPLNVLWHGDEPDFIEDGSVARAALERQS